MAISPSVADPTVVGRNRVLWLSTIAFTLMFNVWLMLGVLIVPIAKEFNLSDSQKEWLIATAILSGSLLRLNFGIWADRYGGRNMMMLLLVLSAIPAYLFSHASNYTELVILTFFFGLAGNSFAAGIAWNNAWYPPERKGFALGVFGAGNVGASGTKLLVIMSPAILTLVPAGGLLGGVIPGEWRVLPAFYSVLLLVMAVAVYLLAPKVDRKPGVGRSMREMLAPLKYTRVWRFSSYYVVVFGAYVALAGWLPTYFKTTYNISLQQAALWTALFIFPASLLRPLGGYLSDKFGPRVVTYSVFTLMAVTLGVMSIPNMNLSAPAFASLLFVVGCGMGIGKASVYKYIPNYFPNDVGAVGGLVGLFGALGGFFLPPLFGGVSRATGYPQAAFLVLLALTLVSLAWLHLSVKRIKAEEQMPVEAAIPATV